jgi:hypothetical protein
MARPLLHDDTLTLGGLFLVVHIALLWSGRHLVIVSQRRVRAFAAKSTGHSRPNAKRCFSRSLKRGASGEGGAIFTDRRDRGVLPTWTHEQDPYPLSQ